MPKPTSDRRATERKNPWPMVRLGDVCGTINGIWKGLRKPFVHVGIIRSSNMTKNCEFSLDKTIYIDVEEKKYKQRKLLAGDIIVERSGGGPGQPVGRAVYFDLEDGEYSVSNFTSILRVKDANALYGKFLQLYLTSQYFQGATENIQSNTTGLHNLDFDAYLNFNVPLPPLPVQREIVVRLERELAAVEKMKKGFDALAETAKAEFKAELKEVFESGELRVESGELAVRRVKLGEICETITDGDHQPPPKSSQGVPFLVISNVASGRISFENTRFVPRAYYEAIQENRKPRKGDVLLTVTGSYGIPVVVETDDMFCFQRHIALIRASRLDSKFLAYVLQSPESKRYFDLVATGAAQKTIGLGSIRAMSIPFPSMSAQRQIVDRLSAAKARTEKLEAKAREGVAVCETMRKAILKEAFA